LQRTLTGAAHSLALARRPPSLADRCASRLRIPPLLLSYGGKVTIG